MTRRKKHYTVACLAGHGTGPELMAETSRALQEVSRLHGFRIDDVHVPFAGEAVSRFGNPLPPATRSVCLDADAILVATPGTPALEDVEAELDLRAEVLRVRFAPAGDVFLLSPRSAEPRFGASLNRQVHGGSQPTLIARCAKRLLQRKIDQ